MYLFLNETQALVNVTMPRDLLVSILESNPTDNHLQRAFSNAATDLADLDLAINGSPLISFELMRGAIHKEAIELLQRCYNIDGKTSVLPWMISSCWEFSANIVWPFHILADHAESHGPKIARAHDHKDTYATQDRATYDSYVNLLRAIILRYANWIMKINEDLFSSNAIEQNNGYQQGNVPHESSSVMGQDSRIIHISMDEVYSSLPIPIQEIARQNMKLDFTGLLGMKGFPKTKTAATPRDGDDHEFASHLDIPYSKSDPASRVGGFILLRPLLLADSTPMISPSQRDWIMARISKIARLRRMDRKFVEVESVENELFWDNNEASGNEKRCTKESTVRNNMMSRAALATNSTLRLVFQR